MIGLSPSTKSSRRVPRLTMFCHHCAANWRHGDKRTGAREIAVPGWRLLSAIAAAIVLAWAADAAAASELSTAIANMYSGLTVPPPTAEQMTVCYGFGCTRRWRLDFTAADHKNLTGLLAAGRPSAAAERAAVQRAVAWFDRRVGPLIGTSKRVANADTRTLDPAHNFDCFDTTRNTTSLLLVLERWNLLRYHVVGDPRYRGNILRGQLPHNTAVLSERATGIGWAVDMWPRGYGEFPDVMTVEQWLNEL
jgi:hypothetical protein